MSSIYLHYAFIDETGSVALSEQSHFLIIAALCTDAPRPIERIIRKAQKKFGSALGSGELKAKKASDKLVVTVLDALVREPIEIFAIVLDSRLLEDPAQEPEEIYRRATARLIRKLAGRFPRIEITLDRRYTSEHLRYLLEVSIRAELAELPRQMVLIRQEDSALVKELQAVDFIAWAFFQKYEHGNPQFYERIVPRVVEEEWVTKQSWEQG